MVGRSSRKPARRRASPVCYIVPSTGRGGGTALLWLARSGIRRLILSRKPAMLLIQVLSEGCRDCFEESLGLLGGERIGVMDDSVEQGRFTEEDRCLLQ